MVCLESGDLPGRCCLGAAWACVLVTRGWCHRALHFGYTDGRDLLRFIVRHVHAHQGAREKICRLEIMLAHIGVLAYPY